MTLPATILAVPYVLSAAIILETDSIPWLPLLAFLLPGLVQVVVVTIILSRMYERIDSMKEKFATMIDEHNKMRTRVHQHDSQITALMFQSGLREMDERDKNRD